jgi:hypothetical protein
VIEGLRLMPWWHEAARRDLLGPKSNCRECRSRLSAESRQMAGCPYEPPVPPDLAPIVRPWAGLGYAGDMPSVCPGYSTTLPEAIEIARGRMHWSKGELGQFCGGQASEAMIIGIEIAEAAGNEFQAWRTTPSSKGGGAD